MVCASTADTVSIDKLAELADKIIEVAAQCLCQQSEVELKSLVSKTSSNLSSLEV